MRVDAQRALLEDRIIGIIGGPPECSPQVAEETEER
jgi:hypothetical protein